MKTTKVFFAFRSFALHLFAFLCCVSVQGQLHIDLEVADQTNQIFSLLEKSKIPHNMLLDYGYDFVDVTNYDGVLRDNNYLVPSVYRDLYNSVVSMRTTLTVPELVDPMLMEQGWKSTSKTELNKLGKGAMASAVVLNGMYYQYARFRPDALQNGLIAVENNKYRDVYVGTEWQDPYEEMEVFAMTLPVTQISNSKVSVVLGKTDWRTNQPGLVEEFAVDFGDGGGFEPMLLGVSVDHYFEQDGEYVWTFRLKLTDGTFKYCRTPVKVTGKAKQQTLTARNPDCDKKPWVETITAAKGYMGIKGVANLQIAPAKECTKIHKPLIVVEGFDTGLMGNDPEWGDTHLKSFLDEVRFKSQSQELQNLITEDTEESFDIIYVNWEDGTDWLQRNAYALEAVIEWVNNNKEDDAAPNVVLGQSMGGVIARYALRDMENNNVDHDTSLYISHDAPHQGAHVPPGFLYAARHVLNELIATPVGDVTVAVASNQFPVDDARQLIDRPAVKQMLINYVDSDYELNNTVHKAWQTELKNMGYPQQTRNIAISNGSHCAEGYGLEPGKSLFWLHGRASTSLIGDFLLFLYPALGGIPGAAFGDIPAAILGFVPGKTTLKTDFQAWAIPGNVEDLIYKGWIQYEKKSLWILPITRTLTNKAIKWQGENVYWANFPGGAMPFINTVDDFNINDEETIVDFLLNYDITLETPPDLNFIPTTSALDVGGNNVALTEEDHYRVYTMDAELPDGLKIQFDNFATTYNISGKNADHISFNKANGNWLADELNEAASILDCTFLCGSSFVIEGNEEFCEQEIYFVDVKGDMQVYWSSSNPQAATPVDPNSPATSFTTSPNSYQESVTIYATLTSESCAGDPIVLEKTVHVGKPGLPSNLSGPEVVLTGALVNYFGGPAEGADYYEWWLPHPFDVVGQFDYFGDNWQILSANTYYDVANVFTGYAKHEGWVQLMGVNECGRGPARKLYVKHAGDGEPGGGGIPLEQPPGYQPNPNSNGIRDGVVIYPNTATDEVNIALEPSTGQEGIAPSKILGIAVYQQLQQAPKKQLIFSSPTTSVLIDVRDLKVGYYFVVIETDKGPVTKILLVK